MKKNTFISLATSIAIVSSMQAQQLDEVTVTTATKTEKSINGVAASIEVITQKEIEAMAAESLKDILQRTSGLNLQFGTFPNASSVSKSSISIRGMSVSGTLFLVDGRRLAGEVKNPFDLDRIAASTIDRIEIVKGPMSSLYGADATGGVINIITKKPTQNVVSSLEVKYGVNKDGNGDNKNINFSTRGKKDKLKYSFFINQTNTDPYTQKEDADVYAKQGTTTVKPSVHANGGVNGISDSYENINVTYQEKSQITTLGSRLDYDLNETNTLGFEFNFMDEERNGTYIGYYHPSNHSTGIPIYNVPVDSFDDNRRLDIGTDLTSQLSDDLTLKLRVYLSSYKKRNETTAIYWSQMGYSSKADSVSDGMRANVDVLTYEALTNYALNDNHLLTAGIEKRDETRDATVFAQANEYSTKKVDYKAIYIQDEWEINDSLNAIFGLRYDQISNAENKATFRAGIVKNFSQMLNLRTNFAQGYRAPDMREMYINKQTPTGLQQGAEVVGYDLKPEFTNAYEIGFSGKNEKLSYDAAIFYNDIKDRISEVNTGSYYTFENIAKAKTYGSELNISYDFTPEFTTKFTWNELRTENKETNKDLEFNPERTLSLAGTYKVSPKFDVATTARYIGEQYYVKTLNRGAPTESTTDATAKAYTLVDLNVNYELKKGVELFGGVNNVFDESVEDVLGSNKGTFFFTGIRATF